MTDDLTGGLDLLGDWLDAKGYGEEAGLCTRVMDHMHKQDARIAALEAALKPFTLGQAATDAAHNAASDDYPAMSIVTCGDLRAARAAMEGKDV